MITNEEITKKHPELLELREFKNKKEIISAFKNGGIMWEVGVFYLQPNYIEGPKKALRVKKCRGNEVVVFSNPPHPNEMRSVSDMQNHPAKAVFTSKKRAETFFKAARRAFAKDKMWKTEAAAHLKWATERRIRYGF